MNDERVKSLSGAVKANKKGEQDGERRGKRKSLRDAASVPCAEPSPRRADARVASQRRRASLASASASSSTDCSSVGPHCSSSSKVHRMETFSYG